MLIKAIIYVTFSLQPPQGHMHLHFSHRTLSNPNPTNTYKLQTFSRPLLPSIPTTVSHLYPPQFFFSPGSRLPSLSAASNTKHKRRKRRWLPNRLCHRLIQLLPKCIQVGQFTLPLLLIPSHVYENNFF
jgi:hypothetical protein